MAQLMPAESIALTVARSMIERGEIPGMNITAALVLTIDRLITEEPEETHR